MQAPRFWTRDGLLPGLLSPLALAYDLGGRLRWALSRQRRAAVPVLCVGNLVAGGAGKTPVAIDLLQRLVQRGVSPHALTRGYGGRIEGPQRVDPLSHGARDVGDEALLLAEVAPTWVARDRPRAARMAVAGGAGLLVMDDGFQNPKLAKDLSLLVVDAAYGFGNGRVIPAGPLREPAARGLARADAVVLLGGAEAELAEVLPPDGPDALPLLRARLVPEAPPEIVGQRVLAFAGIGRPEKFFASLAEIGAEVVEARPFADHHPYRREELAGLAIEAKRLKARLVTTEKDAVRLPPHYHHRVAVLAVRLRWQDEAAVEALLDRLLATS
jgi:tetraacyldisaccharide 4'-kinase